MKNRMRIREFVWAAAAGLSLGACGGSPALKGASASAAATGTPGFLVVAPDRGFLGNEEVRDAFESAISGANAELVFATDGRTGEALQGALRKLGSRGAREIVVLPLFLSQAHPRFLRVKELLARPDTGVRRPVRYARPLGESYLAVEMLSDRLRQAAVPAGRRLVVVGYGADGPQSQDGMRADWQRLAEQAAMGFGFESVHALVWPELMQSHNEEPSRRAAADLSALAKGGKPLTVVPFQLGMKLDSMMSSTASLRVALPKNAELLGDDALPNDLAAMWLRREINRHTPLGDEDVGVVFLAHGADYHWNEDMREAARPVAERYKLEFAFSMADPAVIERAIRRLEQRGARGIVVLRVFGLSESFEQPVRRMLGMDIEEPQPHPAGHAVHSGRGPGGAGHGGGHGHGHGGHGHGASSGPPPRIRTAAITTTVGGLDAHPLFADALLSRAQAVSRDPSRETVILVAHGAGSDAQNERWLRHLDAIASRMKSNGGGGFRAIRVGTWREDWPDKREAWVGHIRAMVQEAGEQEGRAIVVPARTIGEGSERRFLEGLQYDLAAGFAPHPLFVQWVEEQIRIGAAQLSQTPAQQR